MLLFELFDNPTKSVDEVKHFRTAYGWAGGRNERTGGKHKHPEADIDKMIKDIATSDASPEHKKAAIDALKKKGLKENQQLSVEQLATISDEALDNAYHYGRSTPGNTFGWQANLKSAAYAKKMIDAGVSDIEQISDAIHKGWNVTAQAFVQNPEQFSDTEKLRAAGKLEAKLQQRANLMKQNYAQLPDDEQEKDRVVARALLQAINGQQGVAEGLDEAVGGNYLYHATSDTGLKSILQSGAINAALGPQSATTAQTRLPTVSTTRDWGYASGSNAAKQGQGGIVRSAILVLDRNAIEQRYKTLGTSQSSNTRGSAFGKKKSSGFDTFKFLKPFDINKDLTLSKDELDVWQQQTGGKASPTSNVKTNPEFLADLYRDIAQGQAKSKLGGEFEEAVVVPKGALLLGGGVLVGFWVNPNGTLMNDPTVMNDPRRLEIAPGGTGRFVKAKQTQGVAEGYWADAVKKAEADREARKGKPFEKNPVSHDKNGVYIGDKDLAGPNTFARANKDQGVKESALTTKQPQGEKPWKPSMDKPTGEHDPIHGKAPKKGTVKYEIWKRKIAADKKGS